MGIDDKGLGFPLRLGPARGLDVVAIEQSVRAMLEQILFTVPGERVNRPTFGVGVQRYVFEPDSPVLANEIRIALDENLYNYLGTRVRILLVTVEQNEESLQKVGVKAGEGGLFIRVVFEVTGTVSETHELEVVVPAEGAS